MITSIISEEQNRRTKSSYLLAQQLWGLLNFDWLVYLLKSLNVLTTNYNLEKGKFCVESLGMYDVCTMYINSFLNPFRKQVDAHKTIIE